MGKLHYNVFESLIYLSPVTGTILLLLSAAIEWTPMTAPGGGFAKMWASPGLYTAALAMSFLVNMTTYIAIRQSSSLTFKVMRSIYKPGARVSVLPPPLLPTLCWKL